MEHAPSQPENQLERIRAAALLYNGKIFAGATHAEAFI